MPPLPSRSALVLAAVASVAGCDIPRDPAGTLDRVRGGVLRVGVTEARPWVVRSGDEAEGVEPELIRRFAASLGAEVEWHWGGMAEHMDALAHYDLDVVIGGLGRTTPWRRHVGLTQPWHTTRLLVTAPRGDPPPGEEAVEGAAVAVRPGSAAAGFVRSAGAEPYPLERLRDAEGLLAADDWEMPSLGRDTLGWTAHRHRHVMAVPPGENGFLTALENALHGADVAPLVRRWAGSAP